MGKSKENIQASAEFIRSVLEKNFNQKVKAKDLKAAAEKLCEAVPGKTDLAA
jgi:uncharacterized protein YktA (UPF0223 family)